MKKFRGQASSVWVKASLAALAVLFVLVVCYLIFGWPGFRPVPGQIDVHLVNPESNEMAVALYDDLRALYGRKIISGQQTWSYPEAPGGFENDVILQMTGQLPALNGFDLLQYAANGDREQIQAAMAWHQERGGIVAFCWHWQIPGQDGQLTYESKKTGFDLKKGLEAGTDENDRLMRDLARAADGLKMLKQAGVPVLWRPLHEANLGYFWWSSQGPSAYRQLWDLMFNYFTKERALDNLIWVWNGQNRDWLIPTEQFDIAAMDIYPRTKIDRSSQIRLFRRCQTLAPTKMVALSECEFIPDPDRLIRDQAGWLWYMTWHTSYLYEAKREDGRPMSGSPYSLNEDYINQEDLEQILGHDHVLTLNEWLVETGQSDAGKSRSSAD